MMNKDRFIEFFTTSFMVNWKRKLPDSVDDSENSITRKLAEAIAETVYETVRHIR